MSTPLAGYSSRCTGKPVAVVKCRVVNVKEGNLAVAS